MGDLGNARERASLLQASDRIDEFVPVIDRSRRVSTLPDADGNRESFVVHDVRDQDEESSSWREQMRLWFEMNSMLLTIMVISAIAFIVFKLTGLLIMGIPYTILTTPFVFGTCKMAIDIADPIIFGAMSFFSSVLSWHVLVFITSIRVHLSRVVLSSSVFLWLSYNKHDAFLVNGSQAAMVCTFIWMGKDIIMRFTRRLITVSSLIEAMRLADSERDAIVMLCCPDNVKRGEERRRWKNDPKRTSLTVKLETMRDGALDLPLQPIGISDVTSWVYSTDSLVRIESVHQMRVIAAFLRDQLFEGGRRAAVPYDLWRNITGGDVLAQRTWSSMFQPHRGPAVATVGPREFVWGLYQAFERRKRLRSQVMNLGNLFTMLNTGITGLCLVIAAVTFAACLGADLSRLLVTVSTVFVALSFALSGTLTRVFESLVFIFVVKAYEIGDRVTIDDHDYFIDKIELMSTVMRKIDGRIMKISNMALSDKSIFNHRRSGPALIDIKFMIAYETSASQLHQLKMILTQYCKLNSDIWKSDVEFLIGDLIDDTATVVTGRFYHRLTWQEKVALDEHRFDLAQCLRQAMNQIGILTSGNDGVVYYNGGAVEAA